MSSKPPAAESKRYCISPFPLICQGVIRISGNAAQSLGAGKALSAWANPAPNGPASWLGCWHDRASSAL